LFVAVAGHGVEVSSFEVGAKSEDMLMLGRLISQQSSGGRRHYIVDCSYLTLAAIYE